MLVRKKVKNNQRIKTWAYFVSEGKRKKNIERKKKEKCTFYFV